MYHYVTVPQQEPEGPSYPVPEYAACLQGPLGAGIVRARVNTTGVAYGCESITVLVTLCVPNTPLVLAQSAWFAPMLHSADTFVSDPAGLTTLLLMLLSVVSACLHHRSCPNCHHVGELHVDQMQPSNPLRYTNSNPTTAMSTSSDSGL